MALRCIAAERVIVLPMLSAVDIRRPCERASLLRGWLRLLLALVKWLLLMVVPYYYLTLARARQVELQQLSYSTQCVYELRGHTTIVTDLPVAGRQRAPLLSQYRC